MHPLSHPASQEENTGDVSVESCNWYFSCFESASSEADYPGDELEEELSEDTRALATKLWPRDVHEALLRGLALFPFLGQRKVHFLVYGQKCNRNAVLVEYVHRQTGQPRSERQVFTRITYALKRHAMKDDELKHLLKHKVERDYLRNHDWAKDLGTDYFPETKPAASPQLLHLKAKTSTKRRRTQSDLSSLSCSPSSPSSVTSSSKRFKSKPSQHLAPLPTHPGQPLVSLMPHAFPPFAKSVYTSHSGQPTPSAFSQPSFCPYNAHSGPAMLPPQQPLDQLLTPTDLAAFLGSVSSHNFASSAFRLVRHGVNSLSALTSLLQMEERTTDVFLRAVLGPVEALRVNKAIVGLRKAFVANSGQ
ncbi:hypothetical protein JCM8547_000887 [Rhodosporidiobolus lusitaniae]